MFIPNNFGFLSRKGTRNIYGEFSYLGAQKVPCGIVDSLSLNQKTPVRADSSADRGAADEQVAKWKVLFPASVPVGKDDRFDIAGVHLVASGITPRFNVIGGVLDHYEVDFDVWPE